MEVTTSLSTITNTTTSNQGYDTPDIAPFRYRNESITPSVPLLVKTSTSSSGNALDKVGRLEPNNKQERRPVSIIKKTPNRLSSSETIINDAKRASVVIEDLQFNNGNFYQSPAKIVSIVEANNNNNNIRNVVSPNSSETVSSSEIHNIDSNEESGNDIIDDENEEDLNTNRLHVIGSGYGVRNIIVSNANTNGDSHRSSTLPCKKS